MQQSRAIQVPQPGNQTTVVSRIGVFGRTMLFCGVAGVLLGALTASKEVVALSVFLTGAGYFLRDWGSSEVPVLTPMSIYMLAAGIWFGWANFIFYELADSARFQLLFVEWRVDRLLMQAQLVGAVGGLIPMLGFALAARAHATGTLRLPSVGFDITQRGVLRFAWAFLLMAIVVRVVGVKAFPLGIFGSFVTGGVNFAIFIFAIQAAVGRLQPRGMWFVVIVTIVLAEALYQLAFSYLRSDAVLPFVALAMGYLLQKRLDAKIMALGVVAAMFFVVTVLPFAVIRGQQITGTERLNRLMEQSETDTEAIQEGLVAWMSRLSTAAPLSQVCRIVEEDGESGGSTLAYVAYVFIPRAIWRDKPRVAPGQWFAERIGRGRRLEDGSFSNAINMTIPGEFYLNFGWTGAAVGGLVYGVLIGLVWFAAGTEPGSRNPLALMLTFVLVAQAGGTGAHVAYVLNVVIWYALALLVTVALKWIAGRRRPAGVARDASWPGADLSPRASRH